MNGSGPERTNYKFIVMHQSMSYLYSKVDKGLTLQLDRLVAAHVKALGQKLEIRNPNGFRFEGKKYTHSNNFYSVGFSQLVPTLFDEAYAFVAEQKRIIEEKTKIDFFLTTLLNNAGSTEDIKLLLPYELVQKVPMLAEYNKVNFNRLPPVTEAKRDELWEAYAESYQMLKARLIYNLIDV